jgi:biotin carboxyl carrier protein|tara:strand:- start:14072 stop:14518 length:447 start_codon:yes stop_codon:yes gene_type:complete
LSRKYNFQINNENFIVEIISENEEYFTVDVNGEIIEVRNYENEKKISFQKNIEQINSSNLSNSNEKSIHEKQSNNNNLSGQVKALMPGKVLKILVSVGESISVGTPLLVIESMKMENTISSDFTGKVIDIHIKVDDSVQYDQLLIYIE